MTIIGWILCTAALAGMAHIARLYCRFAADARDLGDQLAAAATRSECMGGCGAVAPIAGIDWRCEPCFRRHVESVRELEAAFALPSYRPPFDQEA